MKMKSIRDWVFAQLVSGSFVLPRPLSSSLEEEPQNEEFASSGSAQNAGVIASHVTADLLPSSNRGQESSMDSTDLPSPSPDSSGRIKLDPLSKIETLQINFFRILQRLRQSPEDILVAKILYRIHLATLIRAGESDLSRINLRSDKARALATEREAAGRPALDFSLRILVLGKTGVGKSATINSIFNQTKAMTNAFKPATDRIQEITGFVNDIKVTVIDTPGFWPSSTRNARRNRKIMLSIKRYIKKNPPDVVLYLERLDTMSKGYNDFPLLRLMTDIFGSAMWFNTILVMTNAAAELPEGPTGSSINYESYVTHCTDLLQRYIQLVVSDAKLENPVVLAENHSCRTNTSGERILPNGQIWKRQLLLLCTCTKVLGDANSLLGLQNSIELGPSNNSRLPSLPHLLSSFLQQRPSMTDEVDEYCLSDSEEDEYDQLPPIRILTKVQFEKLSDSQKKDYLDELDYRETLFLKKQLKEESRKRKERKLLGDKILPSEGSTDDPEAVPEAVQLPDVAVPPSFDCDSPVYRYRGVVMSDQWLWRPVLDPHGWDHDVGFDGVNLETAVEIKRNLTASISGQMSKDKHDFSIHSECAAAYTDPRGPTYSIGLDVQSSGRDMVYTVRSHAKSGNLKQNVAGCGVSVTSFQNKYYIGTKLEDSLHLGKRLKLAVNAGRLEGGGQAAYGGSLEATLRGRDYPVRSDKVTMTMNVLSFKNELVLSGNLESEFRPSRGTRLSVNANLNNRNMGQVSIKTSSSEHVQIAFIAVFTIVRAIFRKREHKLQLAEAQEVG
ncbi:translocase of chloroplast 90, chloroplastic-like [Chenopodium quinoa]|uniref:translocase of chloroplast 90, chloroplastic-like n=1 Tax=Chenopodium quinoa TaxID=63459 RepID=UPI000B772A29|nr:translocase of chloroplast 90, chloroplastic-like [Chenopodium quinoa]